MKVLVVFLLAVLGCSLTAGRIVSKCELRDQLVKAIGNMSVEAEQNGLTGDNFVAKLVCHAELVSGLNTSAVKELIPSKEANSGKHGGHVSTTQHRTRGRRDAKRPPSPTQPTQSTTHPPTKYTAPSSSTHTTSHPEAKPSVHPTTPTHPKTVTQHTTHSTSVTPPAPSKQPTAARPPKRAVRSAQDDTEITTLYGIFQLSNNLVCSDGTSTSANICGMPCSNLVDDDIQNDVICALKVSTNPNNRRIFEEGCNDVQASVYFANCPKS